jgi:eukaryotic-like serine/threonine-protein kinase
VLNSKYQQIESIGQGQFGKVFRALDSNTGDVVALKELDTRRFPTKTFLRELSFLVSLQHPNIVACRGLEYSQTGRYLVMDYCEAGTLRDLMESDTPIGLSQYLKLAIDILSGLEYIHDRGIVHCDLKPENILLKNLDGNLIACLADFGIAQLYSQDAKNDPNKQLGSPAYMAPERFYGRCSPLSDLYAVGIILYELVIGDRPFIGIPQEIIHAQINQQIVLPNHIPLLLRSLIVKSLEKLPIKRFKSAGEFLKSLQLATEVIILESNAN